MVSSISAAIAGEIIISKARRVSHNLRILCASKQNGETESQGIVAWPAAVGRSASAKCESGQAKICRHMWRQAGHAPVTRHWLVPSATLAVVNTGEVA